MSRSFHKTLITNAGRHRLKPHRRSCWKQERMMVRSHLHHERWERAKERHARYRYVKWDCKELMWLESRYDTTWCTCREQRQCFTHSVYGSHAAYLRIIRRK